MTAESCAKSLIMLGVEEHMVGAGGNMGDISEILD